MLTAGNCRIPEGIVVDVKNKPCPPPTDDYPVENDEEFANASDTTGDVYAGESPDAASMSPKW